MSLPVNCKQDLDNLIVEQHLLLMSLRLYRRAISIDFSFTALLNTGEMQTNTLMATIPVHHRYTREREKWLCEQTELQQPDHHNSVFRDPSLHYGLKQVMIWTTKFLTVFLIEFSDFQNILYNDFHTENKQYLLLNIWCITALSCTSVKMWYSI